MMSPNEALTGAVDLPIPPYELRVLVGPTDAAAFDNPRAGLVFDDLRPEQYRSVVDLGCGCGRIARQLIQQVPRPDHYLGIDLHRGMIRWCTDNLAPAADGFRFVHHDVFEAGFNPTGRPIDELLPIPADDGSATLVVAWSVFTHLVQEQIPHYLAEVSRILAPNGLVRSTWFLFDRRFFPMLQDFQHALYINRANPTNAVIVDREWLLDEIARCGLSVESATPPSVRGFQWTIDLRHAGPSDRPPTLGPDNAPFGVIRAEVSAVAEHLVGFSANGDG